MKNIEYWEDLQIPARLFFEIIETSNINLLIIKYKPKEAVLKQAWAKIYDLYFEKREDGKMRSVLDIQKKIALIDFKINIIKDALKFLVIVNLPKEHLSKVCKSLKKLGIKINENAPINEEVLSKLQIDVNNLNIQKDNEVEKLKGLTSGVKSSYEDTCVSIENVLERSISEDVSLAKFIALENSAKIKSKALESKRNKRK